MRRLALVLFVLSGCNQLLGVEDVTLGDDAPIDAPVGSIDAPAGTIDASPFDAAPADASLFDAQPNVSTKLGRRCANDSECTADAPNCVTLTGSSESWCTLPCGTTSDNTSPPIGGDAACVGGYDGSAGTPACAIYTPNGPNFDWFCVIGCPGGQGDCPNDLTCGATSTACGGG